MALKKIDKLKNSSANRIAKEKKKISQPPILLISPQNRTQLPYPRNYITRSDNSLCQIGYQRYAHFSFSLPPPSYIWRSNREESSPFRHSISATRARRDAVLPPPESSLLHPLRYPFLLLLSSLGSPVDKGGWITGGEETISRGASVRSAHVSLVDNAKPARVHNKLLAKLTVLFVTPENEISCFEAEATWSGKEGKESGRNKDILWIFRFRFFLHDWLNFDEKKMEDYYSFSFSFYSYIFFFLDCKLDCFLWLWLYVDYTIRYDTIKMQIRGIKYLKIFRNVLEIERSRNWK